MQKLAMSQQQICEKYHSKWNPIKPNEMVAIALQTLGQQPINASRVILREGETISWFIFVVNIRMQLIFINLCMHRIWINIYLK